MRCLHCNSIELHKIYIPLGTQRNSIVHDCHDCGLIQTVSDQSESRIRSLSSDADWGNVRHAKPLRLAANKEVIFKTLLALPDNTRILDVGASRGHFYEVVKNLLPNYHYVGVENDLSLPNFHKEKGKVYKGRFEEIVVEIKDEFFDFILLNHTLEHTDDPSNFLRKCAEHLTDDGLIWIDVPNVDAIDRSDVLEEFFIDKHTVHFSRQTLANMCSSSNLMVVNDLSDEFNLVYLCRKSQAPNQPSNKVIACQESRILKYYENLQRNRNSINTLCMKIAKLSDGLVIFGAGRILDSIMRYGNLETSNLTICDNYLYEYAANLGVEIVNPANVDWEKTKRVLVLARSSRGEIAAFLKSKNALLEVLFLEDL